MKMLILLSLALTSLNAFAFNGNVGRSTAFDYAKNPIAETVEKQFLNVKANGAIPAGAVAALDLTADNGASVVIAPTSGLAPVCVMVNACADAAICSCQNYGLFDSALFDVTAASAVAGHKVVSATGSAGYIAARGTDVATEPSIGYFYDSASASGSVQIFIKL